MNDKKYFTIKEAAFYMNIQVQTLEHLINEGKIVVTSNLKISKEVLNTFMEDLKAWENE